MTEIEKAIGEFRRTQSLSAAQALEVLLEDSYPDDSVVLEVVDALAQFRPGGSASDLLLDEDAILRLLNSAEGHILGLPLALASRSSWKTLPPPTNRTSLRITKLFSDAEGARMIQGFIPREMEDRWFIYFEDGWLNFHRSWTGAHIFALRLDGSPFDVRVVNGWVSGDDESYHSQGAEQDAVLLLEVIESHFGDASRRE